MTITKAIEFFKNNKVKICLPLICVLQFLACFYYDLWIVATCIAVALIIFSDFAHIIYYTLFFSVLFVNDH